MTMVSTVSSEDILTALKYNTSMYTANEDDTATFEIDFAINQIPDLTVTGIFVVDASANDITDITANDEDVSSNKIDYVANGSMWDFPKASFDSSENYVSLAEDTSSNIVTNITFDAQETVNFAINYYGTYDGSDEKLLFCALYSISDPSENIVWDGSANSISIIKNNIGFSAPATTANSINNAISRIIGNVFGGSVLSIPDSQNPTKGLTNYLSALVELSQNDALNDYEREFVNKLIDLVKRAIANVVTNKTKYTEDQIKPITPTINYVFA